MNTENNKLIAEFMGMKYGKYRRFKNGKWTHSETSLSNFATDWNWLIVAVEKIESMNYYVDIMNKAVSINNDEDMIVDLSGKDFSTKIEAVYTAVLEFIKWYNKTQNTNF
jgi:hypothetical protein